MLEATLLIIILSSGGDYTVEMPSMKECLDARTTISEQDPTVKTLCIPMADDTAKMQEFMAMFMAMINQIKDGESNEKESEIDWLNVYPRGNICDEKFKLDWLRETPTSCSQDSPLKRN